MKTFLCAVLLLCLSAAQAEGFWTLNDDPYYHLDSGCDGGSKVAVSEDAAVLFGKAPCPVCVSGLQPVYTGGGLPDWPEDCGMWEISWTLTPERRNELRGVLPQWYRDASAAVGEAFDARHGEIYDPATQSAAPQEPYPEYYGGRYLNCSGVMTYLLVNPTEETLRDFAERYGTGVWIVPAKYGYAELCALQDRLLTEIPAWIDGHGEWDVSLTMINVSVVENTLELGLWGGDWAEAAAAMDLPPCVRVLEVPFATTD